MKEHIETVIIGGGQAGLTVGYGLARQKRPFLILEANERIGDSWRKRWDSLRVFSPAKLNGMPGMRFPAPPLTFPTKDAVADFQEAYATRFELPVRTSTRVDSLTQHGGHYLVSTRQATYEADNVVIATGACQVPKRPAFASELKREVTQLHSSEYKGPGQLRDGDVLVVGTGNSGAELAYELAKTRNQTRKVFLAGSDHAEIKFRHGEFAARFALPLVFFTMTRILTVDTPMGRKAQPSFIRHGAPLIRVKMKDLLAAGVERLPRVVGVRDGLPLLEDGRVAEVTNVVWCTGFKTDFDWIHLPAFGEDGRPLQYRGIVKSLPGLYFLGLEFQYSAGSGALPGIGRDAAHVAKHIAARVVLPVYGEVARSGGDVLPVYGEVARSAGGDVLPVYGEVARSAGGANAAVSMPK